MDIKRPRPRFAPLAAAGKLLRARGIVLALLVVYTLLAMSLGYYAHRAGVRPSSQLERVSSMPRRVIGRLTRPEFPRIYLDVKYEHYMKLAYKREVALQRGMLVTQADDFVPAKIRHEARRLRARIRLKGDGLDHLQGKNWSFRVKVRGDDTLRGMRIFSLQHPRTRNYAYEWLFHQFLKREGVIALRYEFVNVTLNGDDLGLYAMEEHFEKRLIEHNRLREGPIIRFNEDRAWQEGGNAWWEEADDLSHYYGSEITPYQTERTLSQPSGYEQFVKAKNLLEALRRGQLETKDVYDIPKLATYFAVADLMGSYHSRNWNNMRFYYNPITSRLEPIGFDAFCGQRLRQLAPFPVFHVTSVHSELLFEDPLFLSAYVAELERIAAPTYLDDFLEEVDSELRVILDILRSEYPEFDFSADVLRQNQRFIRDSLNPVKGLHAHFRGSRPAELELDVGNIQRMPIEVLGVSYADSAPLPPLDRVILPEAPILRSKPVDYRTVRFAPPERLLWSAKTARDLTVHYRLLGTNRTRQVEVFPWSYLDRDFLERDLVRRESNADEFKFLVTDESAGEIRIRPGHWTLDRHLILPDGYRIVAGAATRLELTDGAAILSHSPLILLGTEELPVVFHAADGAGQGILVLNARQPSVLEHVRFENLSQPIQDGWGLTGAVTFYESPVRISRSLFQGSSAEDALNIVRSDFSIDAVLFDGASSDALDIDFSEGSIADSSFVGIGGDAIDLSGSVVDVRNVRIASAGDKGLSVGEISRATVTNTLVEGAMIAFASKDLSHLTVADSRIEASDTALALYQKKPEFGPATMDVRALRMATVRVPHLVESGSRLTLEGDVIRGSAQSVFQTLYPQE